LDASEVSSLVQDYQGGMTVYELAEKYGCHRQTVARQLKAAGVRMRGQAPTEEQVREGAALYESGLSLDKTGELLGVSPKTLRLHLIGHGVKMRDSHGRST
jgi:uncharacterized protein YjcR